MTVDLTLLTMNGRFLLDIQHTNSYGEAVHPVLEAKRNRGGELMFTFSPTGKSNDTHGLTLPELFEHLRSGAFDRGGKLRMSPLSPTAQGKSAAFPVPKSSLSKVLQQLLERAV